MSKRMGSWRWFDGVLRMMLVTACMAAMVSCSGQSKIEKLHEQGALLHKNQKFYQAIDKFEAALSLSREQNQSPDPRTLILLSDAYMNVGNAEQAIAKAELLVAENGPAGMTEQDRDEAWLKIGQANLALARMRGTPAADGSFQFDPQHMTVAAEVAGRLREQDPLSVEGMLLQARIDYMSRRPADAERMFAAVLREEPDNLTATQGLIDLRMAAGKNEEAEQMAREALERQPDAPASLHSQLAAALLRLGRYREAYDVIHPRIAQASAAASLEQHRLAGQILMEWIDELRMKDTQAEQPPAEANAAKAELDEVIQSLAWLGAEMKGRYPTMPESFFIRGLSHELQGSLGEAIDHYNEALSRTREGSGSQAERKRYRLALALAQMQRKNHGLARQELRNLLRELPGDVDARMQLAKSFALEGSIQDSLDVLQGLRRENPDDPQLRQMVAGLLIMQPDQAQIEEGLRMLEELAGAEGMMPGTELLVRAENQIRQARAAAEAGDEEAAKRALAQGEALYREAAEKYPDQYLPRLRLANLALGRGDLFGAITQTRVASRLNPQIRPLEAALLARLGQVEAARALYEELVASDEQALGYNLILAELEGQTGRQQEALARYERLGAAHATDARPVIGQASLLAARDLQAAIAFMDQTAPRFVADGRFLLAHARLLIQGGRYQDGASRIEALLARTVEAAGQNPDVKTEELTRSLAPLQLELALAQLLDQRNEPALRTARAAVEGEPQLRIEGQWIEAIALMRLGRADEALARLGELRERRPQPATLALGISLAELAAGQFDQAAATAAAAEGLDPVALAMYQAMLRERGEAARSVAADLSLQALLSERPLYAAQSLALADAVLAQLPDEPYLLARRARALQMLDRQEEALAVLERLEERAIDPLEVRMMRSDLHALLARRAQQDSPAAAAEHARQAEKLREEVLAARPEHVPALERQALARQQNGEFGAANEAYRRIIKIDPDNMQAYNNLAWNLLESGELDEAARMGARALELAPDDGAVQDTVGLIELRRNNTTRAVALLHEASSRLPNNPDVRLHLAEALEQDQRPAEAVRELEAIVLAAPGYGRIDQVHRLLERLVPAQAGATPAR